MDKLKKEFEHIAYSYKDFDTTIDKLFEWTIEKIRQAKSDSMNEMPQIAKVVIGDYTFTADHAAIGHLWMEKYNGEGMSFPPELLEKFFNENI